MRVGGERETESERATRAAYACAAQAVGDDNVSVSTDASCITDLSLETVSAEETCLSLFVSLDALADAAATISIKLKHKMQEMRQMVHAGAALEDTKRQGLQQEILGLRRELADIDKAAHDGHGRGRVGSGQS